MFSRINFWRKDKVRVFESKSRDNYFRYTPTIGFAFVIRNGSTGKRRRIRFAPHHGVQIVEWRGARWVVTKQLLGSSRVKGEIGAFKARRVRGGVS